MPGELGGDPVWGQHSEDVQRRTDGDCGVQCLTRMAAQCGSVLRIGRNPLGELVGNYSSQLVRNPGFQLHCVQKKTPTHIYFHISISDV